MYLDIVDSIRDSHMLAGAALIRSPERLEELKAGIESECGHLTSFLSAAQIIDEISPKTKDSIIGAGEKLACLFMTALLQDRGIDAEYVNLENIIPSNYTAKKGLDQEFYDYLAKQLRERIQKCEGRVPVVTGEHLPAHPPQKTPLTIAPYRLLRYRPRLSPRFHRPRLHRPLCRHSRRRPRRR